MKGVSDLYEVVDIIHIPSDLGNLIDKPVHPLDALQNHTVKMNNDLVHETSNLWALSDRTLKYLQYTWEPETTSDPIVIAPGLGEKAANLAEEVVGAPYLGDGQTWGGKGFDYKKMKFAEPSDIKSGYWYWHDKEKKVKWGQGVDCSGLVFWAYNKAAGATKYKKSSNPIQEGGASGQWKKDTDKLSRGDLKRGDLLFLIKSRRASHVIMYVGEGYVVHAEGVEFKKVVKEKLIDVEERYIKAGYTIGYGKVNAASGDKFNIGDIVRVTMNLNVRPEPGSSFEITDPDYPYPGYAPTGTIGIVLSGPSSADSYIWWEVDYGPGLYTGWSVEDWLE
jgi:cell wall-associated NlpC family hydrolase